MHSMKLFLQSLVILGLIGQTVPAQLTQPDPHRVVMGTYPQEVSESFYSEKYLTSIGAIDPEQADGAPKALPSGDVASVGIGEGGKVYAGTDKGLVVYDGEMWESVKAFDQLPVSLVRAEGDRMIVVSKNEIFELSGDAKKSLGKLPDGASAEDLRIGEEIHIVGKGGLYTLTASGIEQDKGLAALIGDSATVHALALGPDGLVVIGAENGLFTREKGGDWRQHFPNDDPKSWAPTRVEGVGIDGKGRIWFASPQGVGVLENGGWKLYTGAEGLPYNDFTCLAIGPDNEVWFGTRIGAIRLDAKGWNYRQGKRWVPGDEIRDAAVDSEGSVWFATNEGVGTIGFVPMTLAEKADHYETLIDKYNRRTEYGYVLEAQTSVPGHFIGITNHDSDNDGLWTAMYGVGECYAYGATKDPEAKRRAKQAFEALRFLSIAPVGGEVEQQPGFVARTVIPVPEEGVDSPINPNNNPSYTLEGQQRNRERNDYLWKVYSPRWPLNKDKTYWYKTDTSSDELDGHYYFYPLYYDLVAETEEEKERVREVVRNITDHLVRNNFCLIDHDGTPTRWSDYSPDNLNHNHDWFNERGLKSLSILSYLTVAEHMTGDEKYGREIERLMKDHAFHTNAMVAKIQFGVGSGNHSDDEMAFMCYYNLLKYTKNPQLKKEITYSFYSYWTLEFPEVNPLFNFMYATQGIDFEYKNPWGDHVLTPWDGWLEDSIDTLVRFPLDRFDWSHKNDHRIDLVPFPRQVAQEPYETRSRLKVMRTNGKALPVDERHFNHWNTDPWSANYGGSGRGLADGAVYLLPYYMGRYYGFIVEE